MTQPDPDQPQLRRLDDIDIAGVAEALDDNSDEIRWWYDPATGHVEPGVGDDSLLDVDGDEDDPDERGLVAIEPIGSRQAYQDMIVFADAVADVRAADLLERSLDGRGAFRRFRNALQEFDDLGHQWLEYSRASSELRAIDWLDEHGLVAGDTDIERQSRSASMSSVLATVAEHHDHVVNEADLAEQWDDIRNLIDMGDAITVTRQGRAWATITPTEP